MKKSSFKPTIMVGFFIALMGLSMFDRTAYASYPAYGESEYWFDLASAEAAVNFFPEHLRFTKGRFAGKPFHLQPWQIDRIIVPYFGWKRHDAEDPALCTRKYRRIWVEVPKKNGKTETAGGIALLLLMCEGELGGEGYAIAANKDQASIVFGAACSMVSYSKTLPEHLELYAKSIYCPALNAGFYPLTGKPEGKHGKNPSFIIGDECHEWPDGQLYSFLSTGMAAREQPTELLITTAGKMKGFGYERHNLMLQIQQGIIDDPETLVVIYSADKDDDWNDPKVWALNNPNLNVSVRMDYLERKYKEAIQDPTEENDFKRYHLNMWTEQDQRWLQMSRYNQCTRNVNDTELWKKLREENKGRKCFGGLDLSSTGDITALVWIFPPSGSFDKWVIIPAFWVPSENAEIRSRRDRVPYIKWIAWGAMQSTDGDTVDYDFIQKHIEDDAEYFDVEGLAYDPWCAQQLVNNLNQQGLPMVKFAQTIYNFAAPTKEFKRLVKKGDFEHGNHPVLRWMASNVAVRSDANDNERPAKDKSTEKIDGIVGAIQALALATGGEDMSGKLDLEGYEVITL